MKMSKESYKMLINDLHNNSSLITQHREYLKENSLYTNVRFMWDCYHGIVKTNTKHHIRADDLTDKQLETGLRKALKELNLF